MSNNFWTNTTLEPKRNYKFLLSIPGTSAGVRIPDYLVKSVAKPSFDIGTTTHDFLNHKFYYPGKTTWNPITMVIVDTTDPEMNATQSIMKLLELSGYELPTNPNTTASRQTVSKNKAVNQALGTVSILTLNSDGAEVERWVLKNAFITKAEFGNLDYTSEDLVNVSLTIQYDNAYIKIGNTATPNTPGAN
jgi:hypothetical protein